MSLSPEQLRALRRNARQPYRPTGALKVLDWMDDVVLRVPVPLAYPVFILFLIITELTPLGFAARMDLLVEQLSSSSDGAR
jgi:hypothetical protein